MKIDGGNAGPFMWVESVMKEIGTVASSTKKLGTKNYVLRKRKFKLKISFS